MSITHNNDKKCDIKKMNDKRQAREIPAGE